MREHGVASFPDPTMTDHNGQQVAFLDPANSVVSLPQYRPAENACRAIIPPPGNDSPTQLAQQQHAREQHVLAFAKCLRSHGIPDFPDPTTQGQLTLEMVHAAGVNLHAPAVLAAAKACLGVAHGTITGADVQRAVNRGR